jgi:hypothetical protein
LNVIYEASKSRTEEQVQIFVPTEPGTGSVKGFAVTLIIGILSSMFTAITGTRMIINWIYGNRRVEKLSI